MNMRGYSEAAESAWEDRELNRHLRRYEDRDIEPELENTETDEDDE